MHHLRQRGFRLREPERHRHGTVQCDGGGEFCVGLLRVACHGTQGAEAGVAMGLEGTHAECHGQSEGLPVVGFGQGHIWRLAVQCDCTEEP